jgi:hypothetical protein
MSRDFSNDDAMNCRQHRGMEENADRMDKNERTHTRLTLPVSAFGSGTRGVNRLIDCLPKKFQNDLIEAKLGAPQN